MPARIIHKTVKGRDFVLEVSGGCILKLSEWTGKEAWFMAHRLEGEEFEKTILRLGPTRIRAWQNEYSRIKRKNRLKNERGNKNSKQNTQLV